MHGKERGVGAWRAAAGVCVRQNYTMKTTFDLARVAVVLVRPSHPGNIGSAARAMKTMGIADLALVRPRHFPHAEADALAYADEEDADLIIDGLFGAGLDRPIEGPVEPALLRLSDGGYPAREIG